MRAVDLIQKKRDGKSLTTEEITWLVSAYSSGELPDYQMSAMAMAIYFQGMDDRETRDLTLAMIDSGDTIDLSSLAGIKVDKHSTGGVGDKVTLVLAPLVATFGVPVAKMSGRGLGHTGGTLDKLESIKGYRVELSEAEFVKQVSEIGLAVIGQSEDLVKADKLLYALRDVTATVESIPLITSSIMSKKIAAGTDAILLDVTVGDGAFMKTSESAEILARKMVALGKQMNRQTVAVLTDMSQPLGQAIGNRLEVLEALELLQGKGRADTIDMICQLAQTLLALAGEEHPLEVIREQLHNGRALTKFEELVLAQGGDLNDLYRPSSAKVITDITAEKEGYITELSAKAFGDYAMTLGAGRAVKTDLLDYETGIVFEKKVGDFVTVGDCIAKIYSQEILSQNRVTEFQKNVRIGDVQKTPKKILKIIT